ncbi:Uncharacterized protein FKW44_005008, partial [Caligus rogercresseyi]
HWYLDIRVIPSELTSRPLSFTPQTSGRPWFIPHPRRGCHAYLNTPYQTSATASTPLSNPPMTPETKMRTGFWGRLRMMKLGCEYLGSYGGKKPLTLEVSVYGTKSTLRSTGVDRSLFHIQNFPAKEK